jgi:hypothetical protein
LKLEVLKALVGLLLLLLGWAVGLRLTAAWNHWQKRRELDLMSARRFYELYGEYLTIWRLWKVFKAPERYKQRPPYPDRMPFELFERACRAEGEIEAILVKIASERRLEEEEWHELALFRQSFQQLRQSIRDGDSVDWSWDSPEYRLFKRLASTVGHILYSRREAPARSPEAAQLNLRRITEPRSSAWKEAVQAEESLDLYHIPITGS